jgi:hypothetical protein
MNDSLDNELREIEAQLANLSPNQMPDDMLKRMEQAMISWERHLPTVPVEEKIVSFNNNDHFAPVSSPESAPNKSSIHLWGAAAAIALMTGVVAVFMTESPQNTSTIANYENPSSIALSSAIPVEDRVAANTPPELSRNITHASNEGITYAGENEAPFKVLRIEYTEKVITYDNNGNPVITNKPCVEHVLIPVPIH